MHYHSQNAEAIPLLSFAVPIRNGERFLPRLLGALLGQEFVNFEIVISDNASSDRTQEICEEFARQDSRIRYYRNAENIGLNANFNRVLELAKGKYVRWIGWDDWIEPDYARKCIEVLESRPDIVGVTTYQDFIDEDGSRDYVEYTGERLDSPHAHKRYARMIWFMMHDYRYIDPVYTMMHRETLLKTGGHKPVLCADQVLAVEMSVLGAFAHIPECLSHRGKMAFTSGMTREQLLLQNYHTQYDLIKKQSFLDVVKAFWSPVNEFELSLIEKLLCLPAIAYYGASVFRDAAKEQLRTWLRPVKRMVMPPTPAQNLSQ